MKRHFIIWSLIFLILGALPVSVSAYSYGHPGEEELAEAYKEFEKYINADDWENAKLIPIKYSKEFDLYFQDAHEILLEALEDKNKELALAAYQAALRQNIERRLKYANEQFNDYGQAKLLLAKARGTFKVLEPIVADLRDQALINEIYEAFDLSLKALGNPGLFGVGKVESDQETFDNKTAIILEQVRPLFPLPNREEGKDHLIEDEEMPIAASTMSQDVWLWLSVILAVLFIVILIARRKKNRN